MFKNVTPESVGVKSEWIENFINHLQEKGIAMHDVLMMRGDKIFCEAYWKPFNKDFLHRQYSQTKSFVGVAIGLLEEEGKLKLDDKIVDYFKDKIDGEVSEYMARQTIRDMLTMQTCCVCPSWFSDPDKDRVRLYFNKVKVNREPGTIWDYDSAGSQVLSSLVERLSGKSMFEYLKEKIFDKIGAFENAYTLKIPTGEDWGDSAMICTPRDMLAFARFVLNYGTWKGERLMNEKYLKDATSALAYNNNKIHTNAHAVGYGYQIWRTTNNCFGFFGLGQQLTICNPDKDIIFVCNSDVQGAYYPYDVMINYYFDEVLKKVDSDVLPEDKKANEKLNKLIDGLELICAKGSEKVDIQDEINGKTYLATYTENPTSLYKFKLIFDENGGGELHFANAQGDKVLPFKLNKNHFCKFPQLGYWDKVGTVPAGGDFMYDCAVSGAWMSDKRFQLYVQIIDKYMANCTFNFEFKDKTIASVLMTKSAEGFMNEYSNVAILKLIEE